MEGIRTQFVKLDRPRQTIVLIVLFATAILSVVCAVIGIIRMLMYSNYNSTTEHNNVEYVQLQNLDEDETSNGHLSTETTVIPISQKEET
jgi:hypothetical protein